jgi:acetoin utilization deacetylase AcuC-like enzyme
LKPDPIPLYFSDNYDIPLPEARYDQPFIPDYIRLTDFIFTTFPQSHQFPMQKYKLVRLALEGMNFGTGGSRLSPAPLARREQILCAHDEQYVDKFLTGRLTEDEIRRIGFPWSLDLVYRTLSSCGGTLQAAIDAVKNGQVAGNLSGGTHHAYRDFGSGYCVFNDIAVSALYLLRQGLIESRPGSVLVVDLDVHQGDGTASIFQNDDRVVTLSFHGKNNFPFRKQRSSVDVELDDGTTDAEYLQKLEYHLNTLVKQHQPKVIFFQAGVDPLVGGTFLSRQPEHDLAPLSHEFLFLEC